MEIEEQSSFEQRNETNELEEHELSQEDDEYQKAIMPSNMKNLRACKICSLVKSPKEFVEKGCDNCDIRFNQNSMKKGTTQKFGGLICISDFQSSHFIRVFAVSTDLVPGIYATDMELKD